MAEAKEHVPSRDDIRTAILDSKGESTIVQFKNVQIEVKSPALEDLLQYRNAQDDDFIMARAIVSNCYVPGTDEKVFTDADVPSIMKLKLTKDMRRLNKAISEMLGGDEMIQEGIESHSKSDTE